jgi:hypothetical protein
MCKKTLIGSRSWHSRPTQAQELEPCRRDPCLQLGIPWLAQTAARGRRSVAPEGLPLKSTDAGACFVVQDHKLLVNPNSNIGFGVIF